MDLMGHNREGSSASSHEGPEESGSEDLDSDEADDEAEMQTLLEEAVHSGSLQLSNRALELPPEQVWTCAGLRYLDLSSNSMHSVPEEIGDLRALEHLDLSWNKIEHLPTSLSSLTCLATLRVAYNRISHVPREVASLPSLTCLDLSDNKLRSIPAALCQSTILTELRLDFNSLEELPLDLCHARALLELGLEGNPLRVPPKRMVAQGTSAILQHLRSLLFGRPAPEPTGSASPRRPGPQQGQGVRTAANVLVVDVSSGGGQESPGELLVSPGADHQPYDEEIELDIRGSTDWTAIGTESASTSSGDILRSMSLQEKGEGLGSAAEAVLARTADLLASGLEELKSGRPITAGGSAAASSRGHVVRPFTSSSSRSRPSSAVSWLRPSTSSGLERPGSARPGTGAVHSASRLPPSQGAAKGTELKWTQRAGVTSGSNGTHQSSSDPSTLLMSMPALTFPLAASLSKLSRRGMGVRLTSTNGEEVALASSSQRGPSKERPTPEGEEEGEDHEELLRSVLQRHNPDLLEAIGDDLANM